MTPARPDIETPRHSRLITVSAVMLVILALAAMFAISAVAEASRVDVALDSAHAEVARP